MTSFATFCRQCGCKLEPGAGDLCPACAQSAAPPPAESKPSWMDLGLAFLVWGVSGGFMLGLDLVARIAYWFMFRTPIKVEVNRSVALLSLGLTFAMHVAGFLTAWLVVTRAGKRPFWQQLGWRWHPQFKFVHAVGMAALMMGVAILLEKVLPHTETELEKVLGLGLSVRIPVALLAVGSAPLIEELVYRGVVYANLEGRWGRGWAFVLSASLFGLVHVPQYWGSAAAISAIMALSIALTGLRAWTGQLLPCVVVHMIYNGIQAAALLAAPQKLPASRPTQAAIISLLHFVGF